MANGTAEKYPTYFNKEFLKNALQEGYTRDIEVIDFDIRLVSFGGENYCSDIYRVKVNYRFGDDQDGAKREINLILKDMKKEIEKEMPVKTKEPTMYTIVIPELERILGGGELLAPKLFMTGKYDTEVYVLEDLSARGFLVKDRINGLDEKDIIIVMKKIARFHAASMVFAEKFPEITDSIKEHPFSCGTNMSEMMENHTTGMVNSAYEMLSELEGYESIATKIKNINNVINERIIDTFNTTKCRYKVINHGDLWINNILISNNDLAFIDLQLSNYGSPAADIHYFLYSSVPTDLLKLKRFEYLRIYYKEFHDTLKRIDYENIPTWEDFVFEMRRMEFAGIFSLLLVFPLISMDKEQSKGTDITVLKDESIFAEKRRTMFASKKLQDKFKYSLDRFNELGILE